MPLPADPLRWRTLQEEKPPLRLQFLVWANIDAPHMPREFPTKSQAFVVLMDVSSRAGQSLFYYYIRDEKNRGGTYFVPENLIQFWRPLGPLPPQ